MKYCMYATIFITLIFMAASGCDSGRKKVKPGETVYVRVNDIPFTESDLRERVPRNVYSQLTDTDKEVIVQEWVNNELLYQEALNRELDEDPEIRREIQDYKRSLIINELMEKRYTELSDPSEQELREFYEENQELFMAPTTEYQVRIALLDTRETALEFYNSVRNGVGFDELARSISKDPSAEDGGNIGVVNDRMVSPSLWNDIVETIDNYGLGATSRPFETMNGWQLILVEEEYEEGSIKPFEAVSDYVREVYIARQREETRNSLLESLASEMDIDYSQE